MTHRSVRSLSRGLALIRELNVGGPLSVLQLAQRSGLNRTTCYRLLQTLQADGFVAFDSASALFGLTAKVRMLSEGVSTRDLSSQAALPPMVTLLNEVSWPSDFGVFDRGTILIHESTHSFSPLAVHRSMVGRRRPFLRSALGRALLSAASPALRREMLEIVAASVTDESAMAKDRALVDRLLSQARRAGYAASIGETEAGISAIALPVEGDVLGALNLVFFSSAMTPEVAARRYLRSLKKAVEAIERRWSDQVPAATRSRRSSHRVSAAAADAGEIEVYPKKP